MKLPNWLLALFPKPDPIPETLPVPEPPPPEPQVSAIARRISLVEELRGSLVKACYDHGHGIARKSGRRTPDQALLKALESLAESKAIAMTKAQSERAEETLLRRLKEAETLREQRIVDRDAALNKYNAAVQALADTAEPGAYPEASGLFVYTSTLWLAGSLSPSTHDLLTGLDPQTRWFVGILTALGISTAIVLGILPPSEPNAGAPGGDDVRHRGALIAGILLGLGFLALRLSAARTTADFVLATGLAFIEVGAVVHVAHRARPLFVEIATWRGRRNARMVAEGHVKAAKEVLDTRQALVGQADGEIEAIEDGLERAHAGTDAKALTSCAVSAIRAGYSDGISGNAATLGGAA